MRKKFVVCMLIVLFMISFSACCQDNKKYVSKKVENEKVAEIKKQDKIGTYEINDWDKIYYLGIEEELVLLEKENTIILADNPISGNSIYEKGILEMGMEPQGAREYIHVKDLFGVEYGIGTVKNNDDIRIGIGQNFGDPMKKDISEMTYEEQDYIPISYWDWILPSTTD